MRFLPLSRPYFRNLAQAFWTDKEVRVEASEIPTLVAYYKPQIKAYANSWEKAVGQSVVECGLFFTHTGVYVPI